jgi:hypothetical protein
MDRVFIEEEIDGQYRIAAIDRQRIFAAEEPGRLATVFECSLTEPSISDRAQIFYALGQEIGATDWEADLQNKHRSTKLNHWSIQQQNSEADCIFFAVRPLTDNDRVHLYSTKHSITPTQTVTVESSSLFSLVALSEQQKWKTGVLQRCIDCLVKPEYRGRVEVYATIDKHYRHLMRFQLETQDVIQFPLLDLIKQLTQSLGLVHTHDSTPFVSISDSSVELIRKAIQLIPTFDLSGSLIEQLGQLLARWSGARLVCHDDRYQIDVDADINRGRNYLDLMLPKPESLLILETPI